MSSPLMMIVKKEVKEMVRDPRLLLGMIIVPLLMFPLMGTAISASFSSVQDSASEIQLGVIDMDSGNRSTDLAEFLWDRNVHTEYNYTTVDLEMMVNGTEYPVDMIMVIPDDFTLNIDSNASAMVYLYTPMVTYSLSESVSTDIIAGYINDYQKTVLDERIMEAYPGLEPTEVENPVFVASLSIIKGEVVTSSPMEISNQMMSQTMMIPMILMILVIMAAQLAATSVAMEKEEKTLETLLTTPAPRRSILFGKICGVVVISAFAVLAYIFGFSIYYSSISSMAAEGAVPVDLAAIGLVPSLEGMAMLLVTLFLSLVAALSLAVLVASFTEDVRSAQALMGVLYVPIFIPAIVLMFSDLTQLPTVVQGVVMAIPFTYPVIAAKAMYTGQFTLIFIGIVYQIIFTAVTIYLASWLFSSEKIMTAKINLKKSKGGAFPLLTALKKKK